MSDEEAEINEKQNECDTSVTIKNELIKDKDNILNSEIDLEDENNEDFINNKDYSQIVIDVK